MTTMLPATRAGTRASWLALAASLCAAAPASAEDAPAGANSMGTLDEVVVTAPAPNGALGATTLDGEAIAARRAATSDTASLLSGIPGVGLATGGGVSSLPVIDGLGDDRLKVLVDGMALTSACPNHMNPVLSYIDPARVAEIQVMAGITPVSSGGDSIGGTISVDSAPPVFAAPGEGVHTEGSLSTFYRSIDRSIGGSVSASVAGDNVSLGYTGSWDRARDYHDGNGDRIASSLYETENHAMTVAARKDGNLLVLQGGQQFIPYEGFPNQLMDLTGNHGRFLNGHYQGEFAWGVLDARVYWQNVTHEMDFLSEKFLGNSMPMNTDGTDDGYSLKAEIPLSARDTMRVGNELHRFRLDDWWPPTSSTPNGMMSPNTFININDGQRNVLGTFAEWEARWSPVWTTLLGARNDTVWMNTGNVQGYSGNMMAHYAADSARFNAQDHARTDVNYDVTALARYEPGAMSTDEIGYSRKTRSPNLYERYAWSTGTMASSMVNWFGDGNGYVGNLNLKPEIANRFSVALGWHDQRREDWEIKFIPYYTYIQDYIYVDKLGTFTKGGGTFDQLMFANHDAQLYGIDVAGKVGLWNSNAYGRGQLSGTLGWMRGQVLNTGNSLYHMMPLNGLATLEHRLGGWINAIDVQLVDGTSEADPLREQPTTPGYALVNVRTGYQWDNVRLDLGIENLFNRQYYLPLGGLDLGDWTQGGRLGQPGALPGPGRSYVAGMTVKF
ncbi:MAG: TonB-dependent receptor [Magnetospirillum sp.]|nr:TonB-dependent receptor [Magnetospirillum sp.]